MYECVLRIDIKVKKSNKKYIHWFEYSWRSVAPVWKKSDGWTISWDHPTLLKNLVFITFEVEKDMTSFILNLKKMFIVFFFHMLRSSETFPDFKKKISCRVLSFTKGINQWSPEWQTISGNLNHTNVQIISTSSTSEKSVWYSDHSYYKHYGVVSVRWVQQKCRLNLLALSRAKWENTCISSIFNCSRLKYIFV